MRADVLARGIGHAGEADVSVLADHLATSADVLARQGLQVGGGDRLGAVGSAACHMRGICGCESLNIAIGVICTVILRRPGRRVRACLPAGVDTLFMVHVVVHDIADVAVGVLGLDDAAEVVNEILHRQVQATPGGGAPARRQIRERARLRRVHVGDRPGHGARQIIVHRVIQETVAILGPFWAMTRVEEDDLGVRRPGTVLARGNGWQRRRLRLNLVSVREPGVRVAGCLRTAVGISVPRSVGHGIDGDAAGGVRDVLLGGLQNGGACLTLLDLRVLIIARDVAGRRGRGRRRGGEVSDGHQASAVAHELIITTDAV